MGFDLAIGTSGSEKLNDSLGEVHDSDLYLCECSDPLCASTVRLTRREYDAVRSDGRTFALKPDHEDPEFDILTSERVRYSVVTTLPGTPTEIARRWDPRDAN